MKDISVKLSCDIFIALNCDCKVSNRLLKNFSASPTHALVLSVKPNGNQKMSKSMRADDIYSFAYFGLLCSTSALLSNGPFIYFYILAKICICENLTL